MLIVCLIFMFLVFICYRAKYETDEDRTARKLRGRASRSDERAAQDTAQDILRAIQDLKKD
jgi:hypothetical protein